MKQARVPSSDRYNRTSWLMCGCAAMGACVWLRPVGDGDVHGCSQPDDELAAALA